MKRYSVDIVIPCFLEEDALPVTIPIVLDYMHKLLDSGRVAASQFRIILIDDGSTDSTWEVITSLRTKNCELEGLKLSRNYGHQNAMIAGMCQADAEVVITMDADLQDDITAIEAMLQKYEAGFDLVLGVRSTREADTPIKRKTAMAYYRLLSWMGIKIIENHADYRLMSRRALKALLAHGEVNLFLRGIVQIIGFKTAIVYYDRLARMQGETKYNLRKMLRLAIDGITSFTIAPLRFVSLLGGIVFLMSIAAVLWVLFNVIFERSGIVPGWASTTLPILFFGGANLLAVGLLGEYIGKIYLEVKKRPRFIVEEWTAESAENEWNVASTTKGSV